MLSPTAHEHIVNVLTPVQCTVYMP